MQLKLDSKISSEQLQALNNRFKLLEPIERLQLLYSYFKLEDVLLTSSFGTKSALLLYWMSNIKAKQPIHFLDTGYHFEETLTYKEKLTAAFNLKVVNIYPKEALHQQSLTAEMWKTNASKCCRINKVAPLEEIKLNYEVWISGLMAYQTPYRRNLDIFEQKDNILKFYPLIDLTEADFNHYYQQADLPAHPLEALGYDSIGCLHCTKRGQGRNGRWTGSLKTECGLHF